MTNNKNFISYGKNVYDELEVNAVLKSLKKSTQMGYSVASFEKKIAPVFAKKYGLMVNSGTSAITLALKVLDFKKGSEVITPCLNFGTAISCILFANLSPILVDCEVETLQINIEKIEEKITSKTKALLIPNLIGNIPDWIKIRALANKYKLKIIEDSADTLGAKINKIRTGKYSDISITSFYGSHIISCAGNGGMLLTNNEKLYKKAKVLRSWGRMSTLIKDSENIKKRLDIKLKGYDYDKKFVFSESGFNFEPSEIGASFGLIQFKKFKNFNKLRNRNFKLHFNFFKKLNKYFIVPKISKNISTNFLAYPIILKKNIKFSRKEFQINLEKNYIQTRPIFSGNILRHPAFTSIISKKNSLDSFVNSDYIMKYGLLIGCHHGLSISNILYIHATILKILKIKKL